MAQTMTIEQAQAYLLEHTYGKLRALIHDPFYGTRNATICNGNSAVMVLSPRSRTRGYNLQWNWVMQVFAPTEQKNPTLKFIREAKKADFANSFIGKCLTADPEKGPYQNGLTTGTSIDGKCITVKALEEEFPYTMKAFWEAFEEGREFQSHRQRWRGYDMSVWVNNVNGDICAGLNMEYLNCGNGYYYMLINREKFIGIDID